MAKCKHAPASRVEFFVGVSDLQTFNLRYCYRQLTIGTVVSAIALVDNIRPLLRPTDLRSFADLTTISNHDRLKPWHSVTPHKFAIDERATLITHATAVWLYSWPETRTRRNPHTSQSVRADCGKYCTSCKGDDSLIFTSSYYTTKCLHWSFHILRTL